MESISCQICLKAFNESENVPLIFKSCGHSVCKSCLLVLSNDETHNSVVKISCPTCRKVHLFDRKSEQLDREFPKNFLFLQHYIAKKTGCEHAAILQKYVCGDPSCPEKQAFCFNCARKSHGNCLSNAVFKKSKFKETLIFEKPDFQGSFSAAKTKNAIEKGLDEIRSKLFSVIDSVEIVLKNEAELLDRSAGNPDFFWSHKHIYSSRSLADSDQIVIELKNAAQLQRLAHKISQEAGEGVISSLLAKVESSINSLMAESLDELKELNQDILKVISPTISQLQQIERSILKSQVMFNFRGPHRFNFHDYFQQLSGHLTSNPIIFTEVESYNFSEEQRARVREVIGRAFKSDPKNAEGIAKFIEKQFNDNLEGGRWRVKLSHVSAATRELTDQRYIHLSRNNWHLVIRENGLKTPMPIPLNAFLFGAPEDGYMDQPDLTFYDRAEDDFDPGNYEDFDESQYYED